MFNKQNFSINQFNNTYYNNLINKTLNRTITIGDLTFG